MGIDPQKFFDSQFDSSVQERIKQLEDIYRNKTIIIGIDRLDYTKGLVQKLNGYESFLQQHPELNTKVTLVQVAIPSREEVKEYQELEEEVSKHVGGINGKYGIYSSKTSEVILLKHASSDRRWIASSLHAPPSLVLGIDGPILYFGRMLANVSARRYEPRGVGVRFMSA